MDIQLPGHDDLNALQEKKQHLGLEVEGVGDLAEDAVDLVSDEGALETAMEIGADLVEGIVDVGGSLLEGAGDILGGLFD